LLSREHKGERELRVSPDAVLTPTAWDYIRQQRLQLSRGGEREAVSALGTAGASDADRIVGEGRCDHPGRSCGCQQEEFGSGFVEPSCCRDCAIHKLKREGDTSASCQGCNRHKTLLQLIESGQATDPEQLIQRITEMVAHRLED
jgi:hypothetical protein